MIRGINKRLVLWLVVFVVVVLSARPLTRYIERHEQDWRLIAVVAAIGFLVILFGSAGLAAWFGPRYLRRFGHRCPSCNKALIGRIAQHAIATGNCKFCGEKVFSDHET